MPGNDSKTRDFVYQFLKLIKEGPRIVIFLSVRSRIPFVRPPAFVAEDRKRRSFLVKSQNLLGARITFSVVKIPLISECHSACMAAIRAFYRVRYRKGFTVKFRRNPLQISQVFLRNIELRAALGAISGQKSEVSGQ